ncbi:MAG: hypothetical protein KDA24_28805, partial [Deltaproteobacteria bacterium]|nr:hypothetical protein [Deltaproteobacteria bacterium]
PAPTVAQERALAPEPTPAPDPTPAPKPSWPVLKHATPSDYMYPQPLTLHVTGADATCAPQARVRPVGDSGPFTTHAMAPGGPGRWSVTMKIPYDERWVSGAEYYFECCDEAGRCGGPLRSASSPFRVAPVEI